MSGNKGGFSTRLLRFCAAAAAVVLLLSIAKVSKAAIITISGAGVDATFDSSIDGQMEEVPEGRGRFVWRGNKTVDNSWALTWDLEIDPDPFVAGNLAVVNVSGADQDYMISASVAATDFPGAGSPMNGSTVISLNDADNDGSASMSTVAGGDAIYTAYIDVTNKQKELFASPFTLSIPADESFPGLAVASAGFGPEASLNAVTTSISFTHKFRLSDGDRVTANGRFEVVPEPTSFVLGLFGLVAVGLICRR